MTSSKKPHLNRLKRTKVEGWNGGWVDGWVDGWNGGWVDDRWMNG